MLIRLQVLIVHTSLRHTTCQQSPSYSAYFDGGAFRHASPSFQLSICCDDYVMVGSRAAFLAAAGK
jgi:hypothetical protein